MKILAIGAHPDDIELGAGGTLARHILEGDEVFFIHVTSGEKGGGTAEQREAEARASAQVLGVKQVFFLRFPDTLAPAGHEAIAKIEEILAAVRPDIVYTHTSEDTHQDHRSVSLATLSAARNIPSIYFYESPNAFPGFIPQRFVNIEKTLEAKVRALTSYASQDAKEYMKIEAIQGLAKFRGLQSKVPYAEAFQVGREVLR